MRRLFAELAVGMLMVLAACGDGPSDVAPMLETAPAPPTADRSQPPTTAAAIPTTAWAEAPTTAEDTTTTATATTTTAAATTTTTLADVDPPALVITSPADGAVVTTGTLRFEGRTEPGAIVTGWDRWDAQVDADGNWHITLQLEPGANLARFSAVDAAGNRTEASVRVTFRTWTVDTGTPVYEVATSPCCGENYRGDASPAFPPPGEPLADGAYAVRTSWPTWPQDLATAPVELEILRFEQCSTQPDRCMPPPSGADFAPDDLFVDDTESRRLILDPDEFSVLVGGLGQRLRGNSANLADLIAEVDQAFAATFTDPLAHGGSPESILADGLADPTSGFSPSELIWPELPGYQAFVSENGPAIFFQFIPEYLRGVPVYQRGSDALWLYGIDIDGDQITLHTGSWYVP